MTFFAKKMQINYRAGVGELIWAMSRPDIAFASVKLSQANSMPHEHHYHGLKLKHTIKYLYSTCNNSIYYRRTQPRDDLPEGQPPTINSNKSDLLLSNQPQHDATTAVAYADSDWATCVKTLPSFTGACIFLAGGVIEHTKPNFDPLSPYHPQKPSSWQHATLDLCVYSYAASYGT